MVTSVPANGGFSGNGGGVGMAMAMGTSQSRDGVGEMDKGDTEEEPGDVDMKESSNEEDWEVDASWALSMMPNSDSCGGVVLREKTEGEAERDSKGVDGADGGGDSAAVVSSSVEEGGMIYAAYEGRSSIHLALSTRLRSSGFLFIACASHCAFGSVLKRCSSVLYEM